MNSYPGGTGVERVTLQVDSDDDIQRYAKRLADLGIAHDIRTDEKPGQGAGLNFELPSGQGMELAIVSDRRPYLHATTAGNPHGRGIAPLDIDHVTLMGPDIQELMQFLKQTLDFKLSDIIRPGGNVWAAEWARTGEYHHDVAAIHSDNPRESLHHLAWSFASIEQIKQAADLLARNNVKIEAGPGRHTVGGNIYAYFRAPGGNRYEMTTEMPRAADPSADPVIWEDFVAAYSAWGQSPQNLFDTGPSRVPGSAPQYLSWGFASQLKQKEQRYDSPSRTYRANGHRPTRRTGFLRRRPRVRRRI